MIKFQVTTDQTSAGLICDLIKWLSTTSVQPSRGFRRIHHAVFPSPRKQHQIAGVKLHRIPGSVPIDQPRAPLRDNMKGGLTADRRIDIERGAVFGVVKHLGLKPEGF